MEHRIEFEGVPGVEKIELSLDPKQSVYAFIGANGVGKTRLLEALFQCLMMQSEPLAGQLGRFSNLFDWRFSAARIGTLSLSLKGRDTFSSVYAQSRKSTREQVLAYIGASGRGAIPNSSRRNTVSAASASIGSASSRFESFADRLKRQMTDDFRALGTAGSPDQWIAARAWSATRYQSAEDNREIEINALTALLHRLDDRIDPTFLEIDGEGRASLKIEGERRQLSALSSGFSALVRIIQAILAAYGAQTNAQELSSLSGVVLIDEIDSHLHPRWQVKILNVLKDLFPNTVFYVTTHSPLVLAQLNSGEAYRLARLSGGEGIVSTRIGAPGQGSMFELLKESFGVDLNKIKLDNPDLERQQQAKKTLSELIRQAQRD